MAKVKTHQGTVKRIGTTGTGKLTRGRQHGGHLKVKKRPKRKRSLRERRLVHAADAARVRRLLPGT
ncbi:MAG: 50S ribosomal protein L35 [Armatimonadota bacterium]|nr:50S ribosomal protein L35 [Armatimonadota bacterium]MDR7532916.1 50S ribosomal protein L35 [Armatimonadota bacterium]MDR7536123.1 50S ribosomal protein L35 [Armatimonadota bacterium]